MGVSAGTVSQAIAKFSEAAAVFCLLTASSSVAYAYRPFEGTDAAVSDLGELEVELGPLQYVRSGPDHTLIAPELAVNFGFADNWEAVWQGQVTRDVNSESHITQFTGHGAFLKHLLRAGSLQDRSGPSVATECGLLLPGIHGEHGIGGSIAGIVSQQWPIATIHLNTAATFTREHHGDFFVGAIIEGPQAWKSRPVAEIFDERDSETTHTKSTLIGAIWQTSPRSTVDLGWREAKSTGQRITEIRAGITYRFSSAP